MRKPAAILLLLLLAFNIIGYRTWFYFAEKKADNRMEALLDKDQYDKTDLLELRIPLDMPYQVDQERFERVSGEVTFNGRIYKYVKRKVSNGNLILVCIPDQTKTAICQAKTRYGSYAGDIASSSQGKEAAHPLSHEKPVFSDYESFIFRLTFPDRSPGQTKLFAFNSQQLTEGFISIPAKPPCRIA